MPTPLSSEQMISTRNQQSNCASECSYNPVPLLLGDSASLQLFPNLLSSSALSNPFHLLHSADVIGAPILLRILKPLVMKACISLPFSYLLFLLLLSPFSIKNVSFKTDSSSVLFLPALPPLQNLVLSVLL